MLSIVILRPPPRHTPIYSEYPYGVATWFARTSRAMTIVKRHYPLHADNPHNVAKWIVWTSQTMTMVASGKDNGELSRGGYEE